MKRVDKHGDEFAAFRIFVLGHAQSSVDQLVTSIWQKTEDASEWMEMIEVNAAVRQHLEGDRTRLRRRLVWRHSMVEPVDLRAHQGWVPPERPDRCTGRPMQN
jgi:hypothetical protein